MGTHEIVLIEMFTLIGICVCTMIGYHCGWSDCKKTNEEGDDAV